MTGIRKKIIVGFISLAVVLFFSGVISVFQLRRLTNQMETLLESTAANMEFVRDMLNALQTQSVAVIEQELGIATNFDSINASVAIAFETALEKATVTVRDRKDMDAIYAAHDAYHLVMSDLDVDKKPLDPEWLHAIYRPAYERLSLAIKDYMVDSQENMKTKTSKLGDTAYRAITPGILALSVGIFILLLFLYMIDIYFVLPVIRINKSLRGYLASRIPFQVKMEGRDEVLELKEGIDDLITLYKSKKTE